MANEGLLPVQHCLSPDPAGNAILAQLVHLLSGRCGGYFATTTLLAALSPDSRQDGMTAVAGSAPAQLYWFDADAISGDLAPAVGTGFWKLANDADTTVLAALAAAGGASLVGLTDTNSRITGSTLQAFLNEITTTTGGAMVLISDAAANYASATKTLEAVLGELGPYRVKVASLAIGFAQVAALGAVTDGAIDFAAALPVGAVRLGGYVDVTAVFDNVGNTASLTFDLGVASPGDTDAWIDGGSLNAVAKVASPLGVVPIGFSGGSLPSVMIHSDVNCDTITKGAAVAYVPYFEQFK